MGSRPVKKGRHRRFEEARALKRSTDFDPDRLFESLQGDDGADNAGGHDEFDDEDDDELDDGR
jgi:hypothetical protein